MSPFNFLTTVLDPGLLWCAALPDWHIVSDDRARVGLCAISGQEANWTARVQSGNGPAHGLFQFERGGGVRGVLTHPASAVLARAAMSASGIAPVSENQHTTELIAWRAMAIWQGDNLAVAFARLLLFTDSRPLPAAHDEGGWYSYYMGLWRPGAPSRERWAVVFPQAWAAVVKQNELKGQAS